MFGVCRLCCVMFVMAVRCCIIRVLLAPPLCCCIVSLRTPCILCVWWYCMGVSRFARVLPVSPEYCSFCMHFVCIVGALIVLAELFCLDGVVLVVSAYFFWPGVKFLSEKIPPAEESLSGKFYFWKYLPKKFVLGISHHLENFLPRNPLLQKKLPSMDYSFGKTK